MDTSETYIKMCEGAKEIQEGHELCKGDIVYLSALGKNGGVGIHGIDDYYPSDGHATGGYLASSARVWLPTQSQLQEMVPTEIGSTQPNYKMISELNHFYDYWDTNGIPDSLTTWEQLWLAFVMKEKYQKVWTNEVWVKIIPMTTR